MAEELLQCIGCRTENRLMWTVHLDDVRTGDCLRRKSATAAGGGGGGGGGGKTGARLNSGEARRRADTL